MSDQAQTLWTASTILDFLTAQRETLRAMGVTKIGLFGSYVRGEQRPDSDIDLLFTMDDFTWRNWMDVWNFLEDNLGFKVDLVPEKDLRPELRPYVLPEVRYAENL
jgi:uncharacterized protein